MKLIQKIKTLFRLKNAVIKALAEDLDHAVRIIKDREQEIKDLQLQLYIAQEALWKYQDADRKWIDEHVARMEAEERGEDYISVDVGLQFDPDIVPCHLLRIEDSGTGENGCTGSSISNGGKRPSESTPRNYLMSNRHP